MTSGSTTSKITSPINFKIIGIIAALSILLQLGVMFIPTEATDFNFFDTTYSLGSGAAMVAAFIVARRYWGSEIFGRTYLSLAIAFAFLVAGDITYMTYEFILEIDPYPSIADVFFVLFYPFAIYHLYRNITYFKRNITWREKAPLVGIVVIMIFSYAYFSLTDLGEPNFDFYYGMIFVIPGAMMVALAIHGISVFRHSVLGTAWLLLAIGIFIFTLSDMWYYYSEVFGHYDVLHPTNTLWFLAHMVMVYGLFKHQKVI